MVDFPPLAPSAGWFAIFIEKLFAGYTKEKAVETANNLTLDSTKEFGRFTLFSPQQEPITLSMAVEGGGRQLRSFNKLESLNLSDHGDWRKIHLRAIEASLGRKPYYRYFQSDLENIYKDRNLTKLKDFNTAIFEDICSFLMGNIKPQEVSAFYVNPVLVERGREISDSIRPEISVLQALATHGRETLIGILAMNA